MRVGNSLNKWFPEKQIHAHYGSLKQRHNFQQYKTPVSVFLVCFLLCRFPFFVFFFFKLSQAVHHCLPTKSRASCTPGCHLMPTPCHLFKACSSFPLAIHKSPSVSSDSTTVFPPTQSPALPSASRYFFKSTFSFGLMSNVPVANVCSLMQSINNVSWIRAATKGYFSNRLFWRLIGFKTCHILQMVLFVH